MSARTIKILGVAVVVLFAAVFLLNRQRNAGGETEALLFPNLEEQLDAVTGVTVTDADSEVTIARGDERWIVPGKGGYQANTGALRDLLIALAETRKIEQKTSNSEYYDRLGLQAPDAEDSTGILVETSGPGAAAISVILGDSAQGEYRYARVPDDAQSWLIDRNPDIPDDAAGWLVADIVDIPASRIQTVSVTHQDGETIRLHKDSEDAANFAIEGIPDGRELSYPSVGNSIAAAVGSLTMEDVRPAEESAASDEAPAATTVYTTFDGLQLTVDITNAAEETWIRLQAKALPVDGGDKDEKPEAEEPASKQEDTDTVEPASEPEETEPTEPEANADETATPDPAEQAETINARVSGWEYRIPQYKATQLTRRWDDLLSDPEPEPKPEPEPEPEPEPAEE